MGNLRTILISIVTMIAAASCSVISKQVRSEAVSPAVPFRHLIEEADTYSGRTVILGGYILETRNLEKETILKVLQVPLQVGEEPTTKDRSEGRFIVYHKGFLDPEVYKKDRAITAAGFVLGTVVEKIGELSSAREFHPNALQEPYVTVSRHTAPTVQSMIEGQTPRMQIVWVPGVQYGSTIESP